MFWHQDKNLIFFFIIQTQVEYAIEAIKLGSTAIGIRTDEGCVLACEKRLTSSLMEPTTIEKIVEVDKHLATAYSGLAAGNTTSTLNHLKKTV